MLTLVIANVLLFSLVAACATWAVREERRRMADASLRIP